MRRKNPQTVRGWARKYKRMHARYDDVKARADEFKARADAFEERLIRARKEIAALVAELKAERDRVIADNWAQYDRAVDQTTARELALFQASPAYIRYQQQRAVSAEKEPWTEEEKKRRLLVSGNWKQP